MQIKKSVLRARLERSMAKLKANEEEVNAKFPAYRDSMLAALKVRVAAVETATSVHEVEMAMRVVTLPNVPELPYYHKTNVKRVQRNMDILDAIEDEVIEVEKLRTGKTFAFDSIFSEEFDD